MNQAMTIEEEVQELCENQKFNNLYKEIFSLKLDDLRLSCRIYNLNTKVISETGEPVNKATKEQIAQIIFLKLHVKQEYLNEGVNKIKEDIEKKKEEIKARKEEIRKQKELEQEEEQPKENQMQLGTGLEEQLEQELKELEEYKDDMPKEKVQVIEDKEETNQTIKAEIKDVKESEASLSLGIDLGAMFENALVKFVNQKGNGIILNTINGELEKALSKVHINRIKVPEVKEVDIKGRLHSKFEDVLFSCQIERQAMIIGPAGSGKTTLAEQIAKALDTNFAHISCSAGMSEAHLLGRMLFDGTYVPSDLVTMYENGGVFLFDEIDAADSNTLLVINSALANGYMSVPNRKDNPVAHRHKDFVCIVSGNSWGHGSSTYNGRSTLDAAFLDRFSMCKHEVTYDVDLEKDLAGKHKDVLDWFHQIRDKVEKSKLRRVVSTRAIVSGVRQRESGKKLKEIKETFLTGWTDQEKAKVK